MSAPGSPDPILDPLTEPQQQAVTHRSGPLLVLAGAGSGKTRVITHRIAQLLREGEPADSILGITFTNKAAREMRERVDRLCGEGRVRLLTFHSFAARSLRQETEPGRFDRNFTILDEGDRLALIRGILKEKAIDATQYRPGLVVSTISRAKNELHTPDSFRDQATSYFDEIVSEIFATYEEALVKMNALDFDDLLTSFVRILRERPDSRERVCGRLRHLLIDEYQDTNRVQLLLTEQLFPEGRDLCVVGDPDQSIYGWRGANIQNILHFEEQFAPASAVRLEQNFRSTKHILAAAEAVIAHNEQRKEKRLWTENSEGSQVEV